MQQRDRPKQYAVNKIITVLEAYAKRHSEEITKGSTNSEVKRGIIKEYGVKLKTLEFWIQNQSKDQDYYRKYVRGEKKGRGRPRTKRSNLKLNMITYEKHEEEIKNLQNRHRT